jgi:hypothetical protein
VATLEHEFFFGGAMRGWRRPRGSGSRSGLDGFVEVEAVKVVEAQRRHAARLVDK